MTKGTFHAGRRAVLAVAGVVSVALAAPALGVADTGIGVPSATVTVKTPPVPSSVSTATSAVSPATKAVENAVAAANKKASDAVAPTSRMRVTTRRLPGSFSVAASVRSLKKGQVAFLFTRKHGRLMLKGIYGKGLRHLAGNQAQCSQMTPTSFNCVLPLDGTFENSCNGDEVTIQPDSWFHQKESFTIGADGSVAMDDTYNWQNVHGVAQDGTLYSMSDTTKEEQSSVPLPLAGFQYSVIRDENQELISHGSDPNQIVHVGTETVITVDAFGGVSVVTEPPTGPGLKCTG